MSNKLNERQERIYRKMNKSKQLNDFRNTLILILILKYIEICDILGIEATNINYFKNYMNEVVKKFKILVEELGIERGGINEEN